MELTNSMIRAAVNKAVESGLLARNAAQNAYDWEVMRGIVAAALSVSHSASHGASSFRDEAATIDAEKKPVF